MLDGAAEDRLWPDPLLVPLALLYDRQTLLANWHALGHVLVAAPLGQAAEPITVAIVASLVARHSPAQLALVTIASPRSLPTDVMALPHQLGEAVDPADGAALRTTLEQVREELDRRVAADGKTFVELALVIRELADVPREDHDLLATLLGDGPRLGIRVLAASERPATELAQACPYLGELRSRLVLQTADEDGSQVLLGAAGAEELGPGGQLLLRLEGRSPIRAHGFRVAPDHLARLVALMQSQAGARMPAPEHLTAGPPDEIDEPEDTDVLPGSTTSPEGHEPGSADLETEVDQVTPSLASGHLDEPSSGPAESDLLSRSEDPDDKEEPVVAVPGEPERPRSDLLRQLDRAPLRLRCFGTRGVWLGERQLWPSAEAVEDTAWEVVLLLGIHSAAGIQVETLADVIWNEETPPEPGTVLRKRRRRLRVELKRLVPELEQDPLPTDPKGKVYRLDPSVIASDVHQFIELAAWAKSLGQRDAIAAYEEALALYRGDLLDSVAVPTYAWLYDGAALATTLRPDYRRLQEEIRRRLADLYACGEDKADIGRAVELYTELVAERPDDEQLWVALLRIQARRGDVLALQTSLRRLRSTLVELGQGSDPEAVRLPPNVQRVLDEIQRHARTDSGHHAAD
jgi:hypothetical protein